MAAVVVGAGAVVERDVVVPASRVPEAPGRVGLSPLSWYLPPPVRIGDSPTIVTPIAPVTQDTARPSSGRRP